MPTAATSAAATKASADSEIPAPTSTGASNAPTIPIPPTIRESQRTAIAVTTTPIAPATAARAARLRSALALVQPEAGSEEGGRAREGEHDAGRLVDPAAVDCEAEEERDAEDDRDAAGPRQHAAA